MKIYNNKDLKEEINILDLGIVKAGETKKFTFYILNDSEAELVNLSFEIEHKEVKIISFPSKLDANTSDKLVISWSPSVTLKQGLKTALNISIVELWG